MIKRARRRTKPGFFGDSESSSCDHNVWNSLLDSLVHAELEPAVLAYMDAFAVGDASVD